MSEMRKFSSTAWAIASGYSHILASDTRTLSAQIDGALEAQAAEIERLTALAAANKAAVEGEARNCDETVARADAAEAERDALREALADVIMNAVLFPDDPRLELVDRALLDRVRDLIGLADLAASARRAHAELGQP